MKYRHSSSFFLSLIIHLILIGAVVYGYQTITKEPKKEEKKVKINLSEMQIKKEVPAITKTTEKKSTPPPQKEIKKPINKPKVEPKKPQPQPKKQAKPEVKKVSKPIPKKEQVQKKVIEPKPVEKEKPKEVVEKARIEPIEIEQEIPLAEETKTVETPQETLEEKSTRLEKNYIDENIQEIVRLLRENLYYPRSAKKRGITGKVVVKFKLTISAKVESIEIVSSEKEVLSRAAIKTIERLSGEFPKPSEELTLHVPINYTLKR